MKMEERGKRKEMIEVIRRITEEDKDGLILDLQKERRDLKDKLLESEGKCRKLEAEKEGIKKKFQEIQRICQTVEPDRIYMRQGDATSKICSLEDRLENLERAVQAALNTMFPQVEALLIKMERSSVKNASGSSSTRSVPGTSLIRHTKKTAAAVNALSSAKRTTGPVRSVFPAKPQIATDKNLTVLEESCKASSATLLEKDLFHAAREGRLEDVRRMIEAGGKTDSTFAGITPLQAAIEMNQIEVVEFLLKSGGDANFSRSSEVNCPLTIAIIKGYERIVSLLIQYGADVNKREADGTTPLHYAVYWGRDELYDLLLEAGADPSVADVHGRKPLDVSASKHV